MRSNIHRPASYRACIICIIILSILIPFSGCGIGDWQLALVNGYEICRPNSHTIALAVEGKETVLTKFFIAYFCFNDRYIGVRGITTNGTIASDLEVTRSRQDEYAAYYLVDTETGDIWEPYQDEADYSAQCTELNVGDMGAWIDTERLDYYSGDLERLENP